MAVLKNVVSKIFNLSTTPAKKTEGQFWYDTTNNVLKRSDGSDYKPLAVGDNLISAGSTETLKNVLNNKANASDVVTLTGNQTISGIKTFNNITIDNLNGNTTDVDGVKISTTTNSIELYAAAYTDETNTPHSNIFTKIDAKKLEISNYTPSGTESIQLDANNIKFTGEDTRFNINVYDGIQMYRGGGYSTDITPFSILSQNNYGISITSGGNQYIISNIPSHDTVSQLMGHHNLLGGIENTFVGYSIGTGLDLESGDLSNFKNTSIFSVGYSIDYTTDEQIPEISGSLVDKTISSSSLDTHIPTSKAVYTSLANKQDKLLYYIESSTSTIITDATMMGMVTISNGDIDILGFNAVNIGVASDTGSITLNSKTVLNGSISGSAISSKISNSSTTIPSTSAVYTALQNKADNTNVVHLSGDEVITGNKTFTSSIRFSSDDTFNTNLAGVSVPDPVGNPGPPILIIDSNSNITIDASNVMDTDLYYSYGIISGVNSRGRETFRIDGKNGSASFSSLSTGAISGSAVVSTLGTSTTSSKLPTEGAVVKAISDVKASLGSALTYEGSVENYSNLPTGLTASDKGKVYNVVNANGNIPAGTNYAWNGTSWDALGGDMSVYLRKEGDTSLIIGDSDSFDYTRIRPGEIKIDKRDTAEGYFSIRGASFSVEGDDGTSFNFSYSIGLYGSVVDTSIPEEPESGHIATTSAIKTYVDNSTSNKVEKNSDANLTSIVMPTFSSSTGVQNGSAKLKLYKDDTTGAITIEIEEVE